MPLRARDRLVPRRLEQDADFRRFALRFAPTLLRVAYLLLRDIDHAEDAVQATMLRVFRHWDRACSTPEAYSRQVLINVCRDHWRRQARNPQALLGDSVLTGSETEPFTEVVERREAIMQALADLPVLQRDVLVLRFFADLSVEDTARVLDIPIGTATSATHRGLQRLRGLLTLSESAETC